VVATLNAPNLDYADSSARKPANFAVALNCGMGSSFLKALERLHMVRAENFGSKNDVACNTAYVICLSHASQ